MTPSIESTTRKHRVSPSLFSVCTAVVRKPQKKAKTRFVNMTCRQSIVTGRTLVGIRTSRSRGAVRTMYSVENVSENMAFVTVAADIRCLTSRAPLVLNVASIRTLVFRYTLPTNRTVRATSGPEALMVVRVLLFMNPFMTTSLVVPQASRNRPLSISGTAK